MKAAVVSAFAVVSVLTPCVAQTIPPALRTAMAQRTLSVQRADAATWDRLTADNFTLITAGGRVVTKADRLVQIRAAKPDTAPPPKPEQEMVRVYGNAAVQRSLIQNVWVTLSWARERSGWRVTSAQLTPVESDSASVARAIDANNARVIAAFKSGDPAAATANYTDDAVLFIPNTPAWEGHAGIQGGFTAFFAQFAVTDCKLMTHDIIITPWYLIERGTYQWTLHPKSGTGADVVDNGKYVTVWERQDDGSWKVSRDISNSDRAMSM